MHQCLQMDNQTPYGTEFSSPVEAISPNVTSISLITNYFNTTSCTSKIQSISAIYSSLCPTYDDSISYSAAGYPINISYSFVSTPPIDYVYESRLYSDSNCIHPTGVINYSPAPDYCPHFGGTVYTTCSQDENNVYLSGYEYGSADFTLPPSDVNCTSGTMSYYSMPRMCLTVSDGSGLFMLNFCNPNAQSTPNITLNTSISTFYSQSTGCNSNHGITTFTIEPSHCIPVNYQSSVRYFAASMFNNNYTGLVHFIYFTFNCTGAYYATGPFYPKSICSLSSNFSQSYIDRLPPQDGAFLVTYSYFSTEAFVENVCSSFTSVQYQYPSAFTCTQVNGIEGYVRAETCSQGEYLIVFDGLLFAANDSSCQGPSVPIQHTESAGCVYKGDYYQRMVCTQPYIPGSPTIAPVYPPSGLPTSPPTMYPRYLVESACFGTGDQKYYPLNECYLFNNSESNVMYTTISRIIPDFASSYVTVEQSFYSGYPCTIANLNYSDYSAYEYNSPQCPAFNYSQSYFEQGSPTRSSYALVPQPPVNNVYATYYYSDGNCSQPTGVVEYSAGSDYCPHFGGSVSATCSKDGAYLYLSGMEYGYSDGSIDYTSPPKDPFCMNGEFYFEVLSQNCVSTDDYSGLFKKTFCNPEAPSSPSFELFTKSVYQGFVGCNVNFGKAIYFPWQATCAAVGDGTSRTLAAGILSNGYSGQFTLAYGNSSCTGESTIIADAIYPKSCDVSTNFLFGYVTELPPLSSALYVISTYENSQCSGASYIEYFNSTGLSCAQVSGIEGYVRAETCSQGEYLIVFDGLLFAANDSSCQGPSVPIQYNQSAGCDYKGDYYQRMVCTQPYIPGSPTIAPNSGPSGHPTSFPTSQPTFKACNHSICVTGEALDPLDCDSCVSTVAQYDKHCVEVYWDAICVEEVFYLCGIFCSPNVPASAPAFAPYRKISLAPTSSYYGYSSYRPSIAPTFRNVSSYTQQGIYRLQTSCSLTSLS